MNFKFTRIKAGDKVGSIPGMLSKLKWEVLDNLFKKYKIHFNKNITFQENKKAMIYELVEKLNDKKIRKLLSRVEDKHIQSTMINKFKQNRKRAICDGLIRNN